MSRRIGGAALALLLTGCATAQSLISRPPVPTVASVEAVYEVPDISLEEKARHLWQRLEQSHLSEHGQLLYNVELPLESSYLVSHRSADMPTWAGHAIGAAALRYAVEPGEGAERILEALLRGLETNHAMTGVPGLLGRSYVCTPERQPWMKTEAEDPGKFWQPASVTGCWFRNGVAKGHYTGATLGLATVIGLQRQGARLPPAAIELARSLAIAHAHHLVDGGFQILDVDGEPTKFGRLRWQGIGFDAIVVAAILQTAAAAGDVRSSHALEDLVAQGLAKTFGQQLWLIGSAYHRAGRHTQGKFSDDHHVFTNALTIWWTAEPDSELYAAARRALHGYWKFARYSLNPFHTFTVEAYEGLQSEHADAVRTLEQFPIDLRKLSPLPCHDTDQVQPLPNREMPDSHIWKSSYFERCTRTAESAVTRHEYSGQAYLYPFEFGRWKER